MIVLFGCIKISIPFPVNKESNINATTLVAFPFIGRFGQYLGKWIDESAILTRNNYVTKPYL